MQPTNQAETLEKLMGASGEILGWLKETATATQGFVLEQAPLVAQEIVAYRRATESCYIICGLILFFIMWKIRPTMRDIKNTNNEDYVFPIMASKIVFTALLFFPTMSCLCRSDEFFMAWFAPRLTIISYVNDLVSPMVK